MKPEPLVSIGQGDSVRTITEEDASRPGTPWGALCALWLAFAVGSWLWSLSKH